MSIELEITCEMYLRHQLKRSDGFTAMAAVSPDKGADICHQRRWNLLPSRLIAEYGSHLHLNILLPDAIRYHCYAFYRDSVTVG
jgi:hypothetical protein